MKLKTLLLVLAILCVSLFVVACGEDETTTAETPEGTTAATTTTVATTKKTTTEKTTKATTTTVATTLDPNYKNLLPAKLPDNSAIDILHRIGFDSEDEFLLANANATTKEFTSTGALYGKAFRFTSIMSRSGTARRGEAYMDVMDPFTTEGIKGVLWYIDFTDVEVNPEVTTGLCTSVTFNTNNYRSNKGGVGTAKGYYYKDGIWTETSNVNACRMAVPEKFKGWVYVSINEYWKSGSSDASGDLYDASTGIGLTNVIVSNFRVYTDGYTYSDDHFVLVDELLYVK